MVTEREFTIYANHLNQRLIYNIETMLGLTRVMIGLFADVLPIYLEIGNAYV